MFEAKLASAGILKKVINAVKDLINDASWECTESGIGLQVSRNDFCVVQIFQRNLFSEFTVFFTIFYNWKLLLDFLFQAFNSFEVQFAS